MISPGARLETVFGKRLAPAGFAKKSPAFECRAAPAPGFRDSGGRGSRAGGTLWLVGNAGYIWSSAIPTGSGNAHHLNLYYGGIYPQYYNYRAYGFPLRCLQE